MNASAHAAYWARLAPLAENHLWQSTLFAGAVAMLTLGLRRDTARLRYWLWFAASAKFLVPFALLVSLGAHLGSYRAPAAGEQQTIYVVLSQPFAPAGSAPSLHSGSVFIPAWALFIIWLGGMSVCLGFWCLRLSAVRTAVRQAIPASQAASWQHYAVWNTPPASGSRSSCVCLRQMYGGLSQAFSASASRCCYGLHRLPHILMTGSLTPSSPMNLRTCAAATIYLPLCIWPYRRFSGSICLSGGLAVACLRSGSVPATKPRCSSAAQPTPMPKRSSAFAGSTRSLPRHASPASQAEISIIPTTSTNLTKGSPAS